MGDPDSSDAWKKLVISKANDQWVSVSNIKTETADDVDSIATTGNFSLDYETAYHNVRTESAAVSSNRMWQVKLSVTPESEVDPLMIAKKDKTESSEERASRLAKMSAYAAQRLANETPEQRATRLKRMSEYAAKRLANETSEQRAKRLARMSAYAAKRLAQETPEQRQARLTRMSAYAAKRHAMKKTQSPSAKNSKNDLNIESNDRYEVTCLLRKQNQS